MVPSLRSFVTMREENGGSLQDLNDAVDLINTLLAKYGNKLSLQSVQDQIASVDPELASTMTLLHTIGALNKKDIAALTRMIAGSAGGNDEVTITTSSPDKAGSLVEGASVTAQEKIGLTVQSSDKIYKRTLNSDLNKLLK